MTKVTEARERQNACSPRALSNCPRLAALECIVSTVNMDRVFGVSFDVFLIF
jgi:hypothetical protein